MLAECPTAPSLAARPPRKTAPEFARRGQKNRVVGFARRRPQSRRVFASQAVETASGKSGCDYETALGRTNIALADQYGASAAVWHYTAFGKAYNVSGAASDYRYLFTGREWLAPVGLQEHRNRYYNPNTGRWLSPDSTHYSDGYNLYTAFHNDPNDLSDPFGTSCSDMLLDLLISNDAIFDDYDLVNLSPFGSSIISSSQGTTSFNELAGQGTINVAIVTKGYLEDNPLFYDNVLLPLCGYDDNRIIICDTAAGERLPYAAQELQNRLELDEIGYTDNLLIFSHNENGKIAELWSNVDQTQAFADMGFMMGNIPVIVTVCGGSDMDDMPDYAQAYGGDFWVSDVTVYPGLTRNKATGKYTFLGMFAYQRNQAGMEKLIKDNITEYIKKAQQIYFNIYKP